jgi:hypothetical protein
MSEEELRKQLEEAQKKLNELQSRGSKGITFRVSEKGGLSVYGLGKFPVTLYKEQWLRLLALTEDIRSFIKENDEKLKGKKAE